MSAKKCSKNFVSENQRWQAIQTRDRQAEGIFWYAVITTGIYCRPACPSRLPNRENIRYFDSIENAESAGFRACKRCKPKQLTAFQQHLSMVTKICRLIQSSESEINLTALAQKTELSPYYFHKVFKSITGLTPKSYFQAHRAKRIQTALDVDGSVTEAAYSAGFGSSGRFYETANQLLGMPPRSFQNGGTDIRIYFAIGECYLGSILVAATHVGVCTISLGDDPEILLNELKEQFPQAELIGGDDTFGQTIVQVIDFIESPKAQLKLPLDIQGSIFQKRVWQALQEIPSGTTVSYTQIAEKIGSPKAFRAVANACASNTLAIAIPCHRVVRSDGGLSGYRWGIERKRALLACEKNSD